MAYDENAATELSLFIDNDSFMYRRRESFVKAVKAKLKSGKYNHSLAPALWQYYVDEGAKRYIAENTPGTKLQNIFNAETRRKLAKEYADTGLANIKSGEW